MITRAELKEQLMVSNCEVTFTKASGEERVMKCTLRESALPPKLEDEKPSNPRKLNEKVLSVWDLEAGGWRSFRIENIKKVALTN